uniref:Uncharacterized protein n=1 Tax=Aegilops tauschii TaxID=37682 RepID=M8BAQ3_AEGTA
MNQQRDPHHHLGACLPACLLPTRSAAATQEPVGEDAAAAAGGGGGGQGCGVTVGLPWGETRTPESDVDNDPFPELDSLPEFQTANAAILPKEEVQELGNDDWLMGISLDDLQGPGSLMLPWDDSYAASFLSPVATMKMEQDVSPFFF